MKPAQDTIACDACGRRYARKPELAGRRVKCKCGNVIHVPAAAVGAPDEAPDMEAAAATGCPACSSPLEAGAVLCVNCGFNLQTGKRMDVEVASDDPPVANVALAPLPRSDAPARQPAVADARLLSYPSLTRRDREVAGEQRSLIKLTIGVVALVLVAGGAVAGIRYLAGAKPAAAPGAPGVADDAEVANMTDEYGAFEARDWLKRDPARMLGGFTPTQARFHVDRWYELGAVKVQAFGARLSTAISIELPDDKEKRKALFAEAQRYNSAPNFRKATDAGQKYILIRLGF